MYRFFYLVLLLLSSSLQAQVISQSAFEKRAPLVLKRISNQIRHMAETGTLHAYYNDSLLHPISLEDANKMGSSLVVKAIHDTHFPNDSSMLIDTAWYDRLSDDSILGDFAITYEIITHDDFSTTRKIRGLAPIFYVQYPYSNVQYCTPLYFVKWEELSGKLSPEDADLLQTYAWWKSFELSYYFTDCKAPAEGQKAMMVDPVHQGHLTLGLAHTGALIGEFITRDLRNSSLQWCLTGKLPLTQTDKVISMESFLSKHKRKIFAQMANPDNPDDPTDLIDTFYYEVPDAFDSIYFAQIENGFHIYFSQSYYSEIDGRALGFVTYEISAEDLKKYVQPAEYRMVELLIAGKTQ